jgi:hypothetical protein
MSTDKVAGAKFRLMVNREGVEVVAALRGRKRDVALRFSPRNFWIGIRYSTFMPIISVRCVCVQIIPMLAIQFGWWVAERADEQQP